MDKIFLDILHDTPSPASDLYVKMLTKSCAERDIFVRVHKDIMDIKSIIKSSSGILVVSPSKALEDQVSLIRLKDIIRNNKYLDLDNMIFTDDGYYSMPATSQAIYSTITELLPDRSNVIAVIGRGKTVGKPLIHALIDYGYTTIEINSKTKEDFKTYLLKISDCIVGASSTDNVLDIEHGNDILRIDTGKNFTDDVYRSYRVIKIGKHTRDVIIDRLLRNNLHVHTF